MPLLMLWVRYTNVADKINISVVLRHSEHAYGVMLFSLFGCYGRTAYVVKWILIDHH